MFPYMTYIPAENKKNIQGGDGTICAGLSNCWFTKRTLVYRGGSYQYARAYLKKSRVKTKINNKISYGNE